MMITGELLMVQVFTFIERLKCINALNRMNEMVARAAKTLVFNNIKSSENLADVLTKPLD